jgi:hypothetical protein
MVSTHTFERKIFNAILREECIPEGSKKKRYS